MTVPRLSCGSCYFETLDARELMEHVHVEHPARYQEILRVVTRLAPGLIAQPGTKQVQHDEDSP